MILKFCAFLHFWSVALWVFVGHGFQPCWYTSSPVGRLRLHLWDLESGPCCRSTRVISTSNCGLIGGPWWDHGKPWIWRDLNWAGQIAVHLICCHGRCHIDRPQRQSSFFGRASVDKDGCCLQADSVLWPICGILTSWYLSTLQYRVRTQLGWFIWYSTACLLGEKTDSAEVPFCSWRFSVSDSCIQHFNAARDIDKVEKWFAIQHFSIQSIGATKSCQANVSLRLSSVPCDGWLNWMPSPSKGSQCDLQNWWKDAFPTNPSMSWNECIYII